MNVNVNTQVGFAFVTVLSAVEVLDINEVPIVRIWDMGDGTVYGDVTSVEHTYKFAGIYNITYSIVDVTGVKKVATFSFHAKFPVNDCVTFTQIPEIYSDPGQPSDIFTVSVTSTQLDKPLQLSLFAVNSKSVPAQVLDSKWNILTPRWRFVEAQKNLLTNNFTSITQVSSISTPITALNTLNTVVTCAVKGQMSFRYIDDLSTGLPHKSVPLLLNATLETSGFSSPTDSVIYNYDSFANSSVITTTVAWQVNYSVPDSLKITSNYFEDVTQLNWRDKPIPFLVTAHTEPTLLTPKSKTGIAYEYPPLSAVTTIEILTASTPDSFTSITSSHFTSSPESIIFYNKDEQNVGVGGHAFGTIHSSITGEFIKIKATTSAVNVIDQEFKNNKEFRYPTEKVPSPVAWICNPTESRVSKIHITPLNLLSGVNLQNAIVGTVKAYDTLVTKPYNSFNYQVTGENGLFCVAVDPNDPKSPYSAVVADSMNDVLYRIKTISLDGVESTTISSICLSSVIPYDSKYQNLNVASMVLDSSSNVWVSFNNFTEIVKLNNNFNLLTTITLSDSSVIVDGDFYKQPKIIDTDKNDNVWVGCVTLSSSNLLKFSTDGVKKKEFNLPDYSIINSITFDYDNNVWVTYHTGLSSHGNSYLIKLDTDTQLLSTFNLNQKYATHLCVDRQSNIWYTHGSRSIGYFDVAKQLKTSWDISKAGNISYTPNNAIKSSNLNNDFNSITIDAFDRLWLVDSTHNKLFCFHSYIQFLSSIDAQKTVIKINPDSKLHHFITYNNTISSTLLNEGKSVFAVGDFTGNKWLQKYANTGIDVFQLSGVSNSFCVYDIHDNRFQIRKINENFSMVDYFKTLTVNDAFQSFEGLFNTVLAPIAGDDTSVQNNLGLKIYEKIANFTGNTIDIDTCEIQNLYSLAEMTGCKNILKLDTNLPVEVKRLIDITSVPQSKLLGDVNMDRSKVSMNLVLDALIEDVNYELSCTDVVAFVSQKDCTISLYPVPVVIDTTLHDIPVTLSSYSLTYFLNLSSYQHLRNDYTPYLLESDDINNNILYRVNLDDYLVSNTPLILVDKITSQRKLFSVPLSCYVSTSIVNISTVHIDSYNISTSAVNTNIITLSSIDSHTNTTSTVILTSKDSNTISTSTIYISSLIDTYTESTSVEYISSMRYNQLFNFEEDEPFYIKHYAYTFLPVSGTLQDAKCTNNIIDWKNTYNTIDYDKLRNDASYWYGDNGIVESMFNNVLTRYLTVTSELVE